MKPLLIGFCGGSGSGKTTLIRKMLKAFGNKAVTVNMDAFYKDFHNISFEERSRINYDHPDSFDLDIFIGCLKDLKSGRSTKVPTYDFSTHLRREKWDTVPASPIVLVDGILLFSIPEIVSLLDVRIYVDTDADVRILRRVRRDMKDRGRSIDSVMEQYLTTVKPMHEAFVEPSKRFADIIVPEGGYNQVAADIILRALTDRIKELEAQ